MISGKDIDSAGDLIVDNEYIRKIRASYYLIGALLGKYKKAQVVLPGGCDIGSRPIDQHIKGFRALGAEVKIEHGMIIAQAEQLSSLSKDPIIARLKAIQRGEASPA